MSELVSEWVSESVSDDGDEQSGKKEFALEQERVGHMNVLVATPGRLLQVLPQSSLPTTRSLSHIQHTHSLTCELIESQKTVPVKEELASSIDFDIEVQKKVTFSIVTLVTHSCGKLGEWLMDEVINAAVVMYGGINNEVRRGQTGE